jgi:hypothetical protein
LLHNVQADLGCRVHLLCNALYVAALRVTGLDLLLLLLLLLQVHASPAAQLHVQAATHRLEKVSGGVQYLTACADMLSWCATWCCGVPSALLTGC